MSEAALREPGTDIANIVDTNPTAVLTNPKTYDELYGYIKAEVEAFEPDLTTASGRKAIASMAYKVVRTKTAIDNAGKKLNEDARKQINKVDEQRRKVRADLDALAEQVRKPLTAWEQAEEQRAQKVAQFFEELKEAKTLPHGAHSSEIQHHLHAINDMTVDRDLMQSRADEAERTLADAREYVTNALAAAEKAEADAAELERLRKAEEERQRAEREAAEKAEQERIAKEAADRAAAEAKKREDEAAERARAEEKRLAEEAIAKAEQEKQAAIEKAEAERLALVREQKRKEAERKAEEERIAAEQARREANKRHRAKLTKEAENAISDLGIDAAIATQIVAAVIEGKIPHVKMVF